jgi:hypothetical protein
VLVIWLITAVYPNVILTVSKNLRAVEINDTNLSLIFNQCFKQVKEIYNYEDLVFTYKIETGARNSKSWKFRIFKKGHAKSLVSVGGMFDGWTDTKIFDVISELKKRGIETE